MTAQGIKDMGRYLLSEDLEARRVGARYHAEARKVVNEFYRWAEAQGQEDIRTLSPADLLRYRSWMAAHASRRSGETLKPSTVNGRFSMVRLLYACLYRASVIEKNPAQQLFTPLPCDDAPRRALTEEEISRFLNAIDTTTAQGIKDRAMFELAYSSGLRVAELATLKVGDIDMDRRVMRVRGKGDKDRIVPLSEVARDIVLLYLGERAKEPGEWVFRGNRGPATDTHIRSDSVSFRFTTLLRRFGMSQPNISAHSVRHATASHLLDHGVGVRQVQELLGHACVETTARYTHVVTEKLARIQRQYHPREHVMFEMVDEEYEKRLRSLEEEKKPCPEVSGGVEST